MKPALIVISLVILCLAVAYGVPQYRLNQENAQRQRAMQEARLIEDRTPLILDAKTQAILDGADRVETFRLVDFHEEEGYTKTEYAEMADSRKYVGDHQVLYAGSVQGKKFADALKEVLSQASGAEDATQCFDPGVGFRVWKGAAYTDVCICFYCSGVQIITPGVSSESSQKNPYHLPTMLGQSRPALIALSRQAFPQDARLASLH